MMLITYSRFSSSKESQNYETKRKFLHMQFSCNEKPTLCRRTCPKSQANCDALIARVKIE